MIIPADKTANFYKLDKQEYENLRDKDVQKCYKKGKEEKLKDIDKEHAKIARKLEIDDRLFKTSKRDCFITLKDHKGNFREKPQVRTLNPAKPELGKVSKKILEEKIEKIRNTSGLNSWKNTDAVVKWFKNLKNKKSMSFIVFDVEKF